MSLYKNIDVNNITLSHPNDSRVSHVNYDGIQGFSMQSPVLYAIRDESGLSFKFKMVKHGQFFTLLEEIEERLINLVYSNSKKFFNGKIFTESRIRSSLEKLHSLDQDGIVTLLNTEVFPKVKVYDGFRDSLDNIPDTPFNCSLILNISFVKYHGKKITCKMCISHIKIVSSSEKKKLTECILDVEGDVITKNEDTGTEGDVAVVEDLDYEKISQNFNDSNFFDEL
jgi:hypothetical protein